MLGEKLLGFRDTAGRVGILDHACPHRCASLFFGRNEENGIRCIYHGWKFDTDGDCLDMPNVPPSKSFADRIKAKAYRVRESKGLVWIYMGDRETPPPAPNLEVLAAPDAEISLSCVQRECNWLQGLEGDIDTSHFGFLHLGGIDYDDVDPTNMHSFAIKDRAPQLFVAETDWGSMYAAYRPANANQTYYRFSHFLFPFWTMIPDGAFEDNILATAWTPMDDMHTMTFYIRWNGRSKPLRTLKDGRPIPGLENPEFPMRPNTADWFGRFRPALNRDNDYGLDREAQRGANYSGITNVVMQDQAIAESMGQMVDRRGEHLAPSDRMISMTRRRLIWAARAFESEGLVPPGVDAPDIYVGARSGAFVAENQAGRGWLELYTDRRREATKLHPAANFERTS